MKVFIPLGLLPLQALSVLQFHTPRQPLLPNLKILHMTLMPVTRDTISFIHLFLSPRITTIQLKFIRPGLYKVMVASMIANLPITCPDLQRVHLEGLPRDPVTIRAVSQLLITNQGTLRSFHTDSFLTHEALGVLCRCTDLCDVQTVIDGPTSLPTMVLPNLTRMDIKFYHSRGLLQGFHGASLGNLVSLTFRSESESIGGFLQAFERVALTTSIPTTLSTFSFYTTRPWRPHYLSLLRFVHLKSLDIQFSCASGCSSTIDDDTITNLARTLHRLEFLRLGGPPCDAATGVTAKGLSALAYYCPYLSHLRIHLQIATLDPPETPIVACSGKSREGCALTFLDVGHIRVPDGSMLMVALTLLRIFPDLKDISYSHIGWEKVARAIYSSKEIVSCSSKNPTVLYLSVVFTIPLSGPGVMLETD